MKSIDCLAVIPARYGSTRFPGKLLAPIGNKSLIQHTYENAKRCKILDEIIVATDDQRIFEHVTSFGGKVVMTSPSCANGTERACEVYRDYYLAKQLPVNMIINLQGDEPCVAPETVKSIVDILRSNPTAQMSTAVSPIFSEKEALSPSVVKCVMNSQGDALYFSRALIPGSKSDRYDPSIDYFKHVGIYAFRPDFLLKYVTLAATPMQRIEDLEQLKVLEHGYQIKVATVNHGSIGVDTPEDIHHVMPLLLLNN